MCQQLNKAAVTVVLSVQQKILIANFAALKNYTLVQLISIVQVQGKFDLRFALPSETQSESS